MEVSKLLDENWVKEICSRSIYLMILPANRVVRLLGDELHNEVYEGRQLDIRIIDKYVSFYSKGDNKLIGSIKHTELFEEHKQEFDTNPNFEYCIITDIEFYKDKRGNSRVYNIIVLLCDVKSKKGRKIF